MRSDSPCQLGALASECFSQRMISAANLLVDLNCISLDHDNIDGVVVLLMSNRLMERVRIKDTFACIMFHDVLSNEYASTNEEWNYQIVICYLLSLT